MLFQREGERILPIIIYCEENTIYSPLFFGSVVLIASSVIIREG
jgi:hypothetical protein